MMVVAAILLVAVLYATMQVSEQNRNMKVATENYIAFAKNGSTMKAASDYLTEQACLYVVTGEKEYADNYFAEINENRRREQVAENLLAYDVPEETYQLVQAAIDYSNELTEQEIYAMKLVTVAHGYDLDAFPEEIQKMELTEGDREKSAEEMIALATNMVFSTEYQEYKQVISDNADEFLNQVTLQQESVQKDTSWALSHVLLIQRILLIVIFVFYVVSLILILRLIIRPLKAYVNSLMENKPMEVKGVHEIRHLVSSYNAFHERNAAKEAKLQYKTEHDPLTGVMNRRVFEAMRSQLKDMDETIGLVLIDVDDFKGINDSYGHEVGDRVLIRIAELLRKSFRREDVVLRLGGDEFAIIMMGGAAEARSVVHRKIGQINEILQRGEGGLPPTSISVGVAFSPSGFTEHLYAAADHALYDVKNGGRQSCMIYGENY
jgi:diguanylate cyclase (GGDEF)-like protein